jgi:hypothetical protein
LVAQVLRRSLGFVLALLLLESAPTPAVAASNISPEHASSWGANIGWLNWRPDPVVGVEVGQYVCSGHIYSANVGWISLGSGSPADGIQYRNNSARDFGVNMDMSGQLRGLAYGANIGWISFEKTGAPRVDLLTGQLGGFVYSANVGWISLESGAFTVAVDSISAGTDSDSDGIPDAWELSYTGDLASLTATGDFDGDGQSDVDEYLADTNPLEANDYFELLHVALTSDRSRATLTFTSKETRLYLIETRADWDPSTLWQDPGFGLQFADGPVTSVTVPAKGVDVFFRVQAVRSLSR